MHYTKQLLKLATKFEKLISSSSDEIRNALNFLEDLTATASNLLTSDDEEDNLKANGLFRKLRKWLPNNLSVIENIKKEYPDLKFKIEIMVSDESPSSLMKCRRMKAFNDDLPYELHDLIIFNVIGPDNLKKEFPNEFASGVKLNFGIKN